MDVFTRDDLELLSKERSGICISLYLSTHQTLPDNQQDPIRFRNTLARAEEQLLALGMRQPDARNMIEPARHLGSEKAFWQFQSRGLAVFLTDGLLRAYRLPVSFHDLLVVTGRFHLMPVLPLVSEDIRYYLLTMSRSRIRLFQGGRTVLGEIPLFGVPQGLEQAVSQDQSEAYEQYHVRIGGGASRETSMFYGRGEGRDDDNDRLSRYFHQVNDRLQGFLKDRNAPLIMAGVEYLLPLYREANTFPGLRKEAITGNVDGLSADQLREKALPLITPIIRKLRDEAHGEFRTLLGTGRASNQTADIVPASYQGRVSSLFVSQSRHEWGTVDLANAGNVSRICSPEEQGCEDLYDFAAVQTILKGGKVFVLDGESETEEPIGAVFRY